MSERPEYGRYRNDGRVLAEIGRWLRDAPSAADLPTEWADAALAAWLRDENDGLGVAVQETDEQRRVRHAAATFGFIGLAVERAREQGTDLALHPDTIAEAVAAVDRQ